MKNQEKPLGTGYGRNRERVAFLLKPAYVMLKGLTEMAQETVKGVGLLLVPACVMLKGLTKTFGSRKRERVGFPLKPTYIMLKGLTIMAPDGERVGFLLVPAYVMLKGQTELAPEAVKE